MITIEIFRTGTGEIQAYRFSGHAGTRRRNETFDFLCGVVSMLALAITNGLTEVAGIEPRELTVADGYLYCVLPDNLAADRQQQARVLTETLALNAEQLSADHPEHVTVIKRRWT